MMRAINIFGNNANVSSATMSPDELMRELKRRKEAERAAALRAAVEKAERDKQRLRSVLSEDAIFSITYVPFVIAEIA